MAHESYTSHVWAKGTVITSLWLNQMEAGIAGCSNSIDEMNYLDNGSDYAGATAAQNGYFVKKITQSQGNIKVEREQFNPQFSVTASTSSTAQKFSLGLNNTTSNEVTLNTATTATYGVTKLNNATVTSGGTLSDNADLAVTSLGVKNAIETLDYSDTADATKYVSAVSETNGKISVTRASFNPSISWENFTDVNNNNVIRPKIITSIGNGNTVETVPSFASVSSYGVTRLTNTTVSGNDLNTD